MIIRVLWCLEGYADDPQGGWLGELGTNNVYVVATLLGLRSLEYLGGYKDEADDHLSAVMVISCAEDHQGECAGYRDMLMTDMMTW